ncbi:hypothetical protein GNE10_33110 [Nostoc sp. 2RC]|nr:hypothetical protein [Nostoc sp. 2RC]
MKETLSSPLTFAIEPVRAYSGASTRALGLVPRRGNTLTQSPKTECRQLGVCAVICFDCTFTQDTTA